MKNGFARRAVWFSGIIGGCAVLWLGVGLLQKTNSPFLTPQSDVIVTSSATNGDVVVRNESAGYRITVPTTWRLERSKGSGLTLYPGPIADAPFPSCKIEISAFVNASSTDISSWLQTYSRRDPTVDVVESSRETAFVHGAASIVWHGAMDGVSTTLAYIATGTTVYEIAPSAIVGAGDDPSLHDQCKSAFLTVLKDFVPTKK